MKQVFFCYKYPAKITSTRIHKFLCVAVAISRWKPALSRDITLKIPLMKAFYNRLLAIRNVSSDEFPQALSIILMVFFVVFGTASLLLLL